MVGSFMDLLNGISTSGGGAYLVGSISSFVGVSSLAFSPQSSCYLPHDYHELQVKEPDLNSKEYILNLIF